MKLFKLTLLTLLARKAWVVALFCVGVMPFILPVLVPTNFASDLVGPARAQAAWVLLWLVTVFWMFGQASRQGGQTVHTGVGTYFHSMGQGPYRQLGELWLAHVVVLLPIILVATAVASFGGLPPETEAYGEWFVTNLQYAGLFTIAVLPLVMLALALGSRLGTLVGYLATVGLTLYGLYGVGYLEVATKVEENELIRILYAISPHYHLADLTEQLVFRMGSLDWKLFGNVVTYLLSLALIILTGSIVAHRTTAKG